MKKTQWIVLVFATVLFTASINAWLLVWAVPLTGLAVFPAAIAAFCLTVCAGARSLPTWRLKLENCGVNCLIAFLISLALSLGAQIPIAIRLFSSDKVNVIVSAALCAVFLSALFWVGIVCVYVSSVQLGVRTRLIGVICGWIFPLNIAVLLRIIAKCYREVRLESGKIICNAERAPRRICKTRYPILLVHGVFFRDYKLLNYWGRIPAELTKNGAEVYYGNHESALSVAESAAQIAKRIEEIVRTTGCEKVNIIAHSKGGIDCRYAIAHGAEPYVASLTTINTPHRGCEFADYLLQKVPEKMQKQVERIYNAAAKKLGDTSPDFMAAVRDLTSEHCRAFDETLEAPEGILCQSVGSQLKTARGGRFPLNYSYYLVKHFDGPNDGLVGETSFSWGEKYTFLVPKKKRGISHGDMIDLNRENIPGFDVREFYVSLVSDLRERGL